MSKLSSWETIYFLCVISVALAITSPAQTGCSAAAPCFTTLVSFNGADGSGPNTVLVQGRDGNLYGTGGGGAHGAGTVFKFNPKTDALTPVYSFCAQMNCTDGYAPAQLLLGTNGNLYGTTQWGGPGNNANCSGNGQIGCGTIFEITVAGNFATLHSFSGSEGSAPNGLVQATDGNLYGTTSQGGAHGAGTVFKFNPQTLALKTLYNFCFKLNCTDGATPSGTQTLTTLVQGTDGNLYGTTWAGGANGVGTVFRITTGGTLKTLHSFGNGTDGDYPNSGVVQANDSNFYGTTARGGTIFKMTPGGVLTTLNSDCCYLYAGLIQATDGNLYGTTYGGYGTVFEVIPKTGALSTRYSFCPQTPCKDGANPLAGLLQATDDGNLYGTTVYGGANSDGTIFSLSVGLGRFVQTLPNTFGIVGAKIAILGQGFASSSIVKFGGVKATTVVLTGTTFLTTNVPAGALTGSVTVTTGSTTLTSNKTFRVNPQLTSFAPTSGPVGSVVTITGVSFKQTTKVTFGGVKATIVTVGSDTQVKATVPTGAKTGKIAITTPGGTATSAANFTVTP